MTTLLENKETKCTVSYSPRFDIWETDDELRLYGDMPGVEPENLDIQFENRQLTINGTVGPRHENLQYIHSEYGIGDFHRSFTVAESIDASKITAELKQGVLTVHLPKREEVKPQRIKVRA